MNKTAFYEQQQFREKWMYFVYLFLFCFIIFFVYAGIQQIILGNPFGSKPGPDWVIIASLLFLSIFLILLYTAKLLTKVNQEGVFYKWAFFNRQYKFVSWQNISSAKVIKYGFVGYGWRVGHNLTVHNTGGNTGLELILKNGKTIIIGTKKANELSSVIEQLKNSGHI